VTSTREESKRDPAKAVKPEKGVRHVMKKKVSGKKHLSGEGKLTTRKKGGGPVRADVTVRQEELQAGLRTWSPNL